MTRANCAAALALDQPIIKQTSPATFFADGAKQNRRKTRGTWALDHDLQMNDKPYPRPKRAPGGETLGVAVLLREPLRESIATRASSSGPQKY